MKKSKIQPSAIQTDADSHSTHSLHQVDLIKEILQSFAPEYIEDPVYFEAELNLIDQYLFKQKKQNYPPLTDSRLSEELIVALQGLKTLLRRGNLNVVTYSLELDQARYRKFIENRLNEEEE